MADDKTFAHCMIDKDCPILTVIIGEAEFRMRSITAGEDADIAAECRLPTATNAEGKPEVRIDWGKLAIKKVAAALGAREVIGREGWSLDMPVTDQSVARLNNMVVAHLNEQYENTFRPGSFGIGES